MQYSGLHLLITGKVQGVCYRAFVKEQAVSFGLTGWAKNLFDGRVEVKAFGSLESLSILVERCWQGPALSEVTDIQQEEIAVEFRAGFFIK